MYADSVDDYFVLHGRKPHFSESKQLVNLSNSEKTIRPKSRTSVVPYDSNKYKDTIDSIKNSGSLDFKQYDSCDQEIQDFLTSTYDLRRSQTTMNGSYSPMFSKSPKSFRGYEWYTDPPHLDTKPFGKSVRDMTYTAPEANGPNWELEKLEKTFFPVTLSESFVLQDSIESRPAKELSSLGKGLPSAGEPWRPFDKTAYKKKRSKSPTATFRPATKTLSVYDKMYALEQEAPVMGRATVHSSTPYQFDLAQLRLERLRIEEEQILEVKRVQELERTRGPQPKWYELKTPDFHYEARKNNQLIQSEKDWQNLVDYRDDLMRASSDFQRSQAVAY